MEPLTLFSLVCTLLGFMLVASWFFPSFWERLDRWFSKMINDCEEKRNGED